MNRTGIKPGPAAQQLYLKCIDLPGVNPVGLHAYDGHIHDSDLAAREELNVMLPMRRLVELQHDLMNVQVCQSR